MRSKVKVRVIRSFDPDPEAVLRAIAAIIRFSDEQRALKDITSPSACESAQG